MTKIMAHLWHNDSTAWLRLPLGGARFSLHPGTGSPLRAATAISTDGAPATLSRYERPEQAPLWILFGCAPGAVRVNGRLLLAGIAVLHDRDEITVGGRTPFYFSTEELAHVEPFPAGDGPVFCARCRQAIAPGTPAVRCPSCGHWCEQSEQKPCWTYGPSCPMCEQPTAFDAGLRWTPEEL